MSMPSDPLLDEVGEALDDEARLAADEAMMVRGIEAAAGRLERANVRSKATTARPLRLVKPYLSFVVAAAVIVSMAMAAIVVTKATSRPSADERMPSSVNETRREPIEPTAARPGVPSVSVDELPTAALAAPTAPAASVPSSSSVPTFDAAELFRRANAERRAQRTPNAVELYRSLLALHPNSLEAHAARVSLGRLLLDRARDPQGALTQFEAYLSGGGDQNLAEEARVGRALAFMRLGRREEERRAWHDLMEHHPDTLQSAFAHQRLDALASEAAPVPTLR